MKKKHKGFRPIQYVYTNEEGVVYLDEFLDYLREHGIDVDDIEMTDTE